MFGPYKCQGKPPVLFPLESHCLPARPGAADRRETRQRHQFGISRKAGQVKRRRKGIKRSQAVNE